MLPLRPTVLALLIAAAFGASAQQSIVVTGEREREAYTVKDTAGATKLDLTLRETPQSITVFTRERLEDQNLTSLRQVLDNTPGIYSNAYDSERVLFYSRGFLVDSLLYDGVPALSNFSTGSVDDSLDSAPYERIEIVRGATGLMTGAGSPAASVNLVRKRADSRSLALGAELTLGSWQNRRVDFDLSMPLNADGTVRTRLVAAAEDTESYQDLYSKKKYVFYGVVDADLTPDTRVSLGVDYNDSRPKSVTWGSFPFYLGNGQPADWPRSFSTSVDWAYWNRKTQTVFAEARHNFDSGWSVQGTLSHRRFEDDNVLFYVYGYPDPATGSGVQPYATASKGKVVENAIDLHATGPFEAWGRKHELVFGYNGSRSNNQASESNPVDELAPIDDFFNWGNVYPKPAFTPYSRTTDIDIAQDGVYAATRLQIADALKLIAGARFARVDIDSFYVYDAQPENKYDFSDTIPYAGLVWDFAPEYSAFASYTNIFKPQSERDIRGQYLDPVEGRSIEVGVKGEHFNKTLNTALTVFDTRQRNVAAPAGENIPGTDIEASIATDGTRTRGFEMEVAGRLGSEVQASLGWTRYVSQDPDGNAVRTFIPSTLLRLFATWEPHGWVPGLKLGAGVNWQSHSDTFVADGNEPLRQGSFALVSAMASYEFSRKVSLQLNANNLFDKKYYVLDEYDNTYYGAPANYSATLRIAY